MKHSYLRHLVLLCILPCSLIEAAAQPRTLRPMPDPLTRLRRGLERTFSSLRGSRVQWGVEILSLDRGEIIYAKNPKNLYMPASNQKLITAGAALNRLGPDYRFETRIQMDGQVKEGKLEGDLIIASAGDPSCSLALQSGDPTRPFKDWASHLKAKGIQSIEGALVGDEGAFEPAMPSGGWEWGDLVYGYAAPVSALQFNENLVTVEVTPAEKVGAPASIRCLPLEGYLNVAPLVVTGPRGTQSQVRFERGEKKESILVRGSVPLGAKPISQTIAVQHPTEYYLYALKNILQSEGIEVSTCSIKVTRNYRPKTISLLWVHYSPPLAEVLNAMLKLSQNLSAETLVRTMGFEIKGDGSFDQGKEVVQEALKGIGVEEGTYAYADGCGLSRLNLVTTDTLTRILKYIRGQSYFDAFYEALPVAGVDGTLANRMKGTPAEGNAHAKTGSISNVCALSGYVKTADGEMMAFSMIANNFLGPARTVEAVQNSAVEVLARFTRK